MSGSALERAVYAVHDRQLAIATNAADVAEFILAAYGGAAVGKAFEAPDADRGEIIEASDGYRLRFDGEERPWPIARPRAGDAFLAAFYGSRELFRLAAARVASCWPVYGAAVAHGRHAVLVLGASGSGKTSLVLSLVQRGARLYGDECIFVDKHTGTVGGLTRALMIRAQALERLAQIEGLRAACDAGPMYADGDVRLWYAVDANRIFERDVRAEPLPLGAVVVLGERASQPAIAVLPHSVAVLAIAQRSHVKPGGLAALAAEHRALRDVACYRVNAGMPDATAALVLETLEGAR